MGRRWCRWWKRIIHKMQVSISEIGNFSIVLPVYLQSRELENFTSSHLSFDRNSTFHSRASYSKVNIEIRIFIPYFHSIRKFESPRSHSTQRGYSVSFLENVIFPSSKRSVSVRGKRDYEDAVVITLRALIAGRIKESRSSSPGHGINNYLLIKALGTNICFWWDIICAL